MNKDMGIEEIKKENPQEQTFKYQPCDVVNAMSAKHIVKGLRNCLELYKEDREKWQDWYEKEIVIPNKLIPLNDALKWIKENASGYIDIDYKGRLESFTTSLEDGFYKDFEKAMLELKVKH